MSDRDSQSQNRAQQGINLNDQSTLNTEQVVNNLGPQQHQTHTGSGDNVGGDKYEFRMYPEAPAVERGDPNNLGEFRRLLPKFVGRGEGFGKLDQIVGTADVVAVMAAVAGMGGLGKTELVWQWADRQWKDDKFPGGVCWVDCAAGEPGSRIIQFCQTVFDAEIPETLTAVAERVQFCWRNWQNWQAGAVLLVLDDVARDRFREEIRPILPPTDSVRVVMTTRDHGWSGNIQTVPLDELSPTESRTLLAKYVGEARLAAEPEAVQGVLDWMGGLPLGIELAGRFLQEDEFLPVADYLAELQQERFAHESIEESSPEMRYPDGIWEAILVSWRKLGAEERLLAMRLGIYGPAPIPLTEDQEKEWRKGLKRLVNLSLVKRSQQFMVSLHPLARQFVREQLDRSSKREELRRLVATALVIKGKELPIISTVQQAATFSPWVSHLQTATESLLDVVGKEEVMEPCDALARFYYGQGLYENALWWSQQAVTAARQYLGRIHPKTASTLSNLGEVYQARGDNSAAEPVLEEALEIARQSLPSNEPDLAIVLNNLAKLYERQEKYAAAESLFQEALVIDRESLPPNHPDLAVHLNNLANLHRSQGKYTAAEPLFQEVLEIAHESLPPNHPNLATYLNNLAVLYRLQGNYAAAEPLFQQAVEIDRVSLPPEHPLLGRDLNNFALLYAAQKDYHAAEPLFQQAITIFWNALGKDHPYTQKCLQYIIDFYSEALSSGFPDTQLRQHSLSKTILKKLETRIYS
ncbi:MAG: tetratricopeptide repeat protein [Cyanobacteria bacterium P01_C01_bin.89]